MADENKIAIRSWVESTFNVKPYNDRYYTRCGKQQGITGGEIKQIYSNRIAIKGDFEENKLYKQSDLYVNPNPTGKQIRLGWNNSNSGENYETLSLFIYNAKTGAEENLVSVDPSDKQDFFNYYATVYPKDESNGSGTWYMGIYVNKSEGLGTGYDGNDRIGAWFQSMGGPLPNSANMGEGFYLILSGNMKDPANDKTKWKSTNIGYNDWLFASAEPAVVVRIYD